MDKKFRIVKCPYCGGKVRVPARLLCGAVDCDSCGRKFAYIHGKAYPIEYLGECV